MIISHRHEESNAQILLISGSQSFSFAVLLSQLQWLCWLWDMGFSKDLQDKYIFHTGSCIQRRKEEPIHCPGVGHTTHNYLCTCHTEEVSFWGVLLGQDNHSGISVCRRGWIEHRGWGPTPTFESANHASFVILISLQWWSPPIHRLTGRAHFWGTLCTCFHGSLNSAFLEAMTLHAGETPRLLACS